uniref:Uncharacterized protein n=1 Tax=Glossina pallidipes TaxID=7398 RepID=A0A1B0A3M4_GLOPL
MYKVRTTQLGVDGDTTDIRGVVIAVGFNEKNGNRLLLVILCIDELFVLIPLAFLSILITDEFSGDNNVRVAEISAGFSFVVMTTALVISSTESSLKDDKRLGKYGDDEEDNFTRLVVVVKTVEDNFSQTQMVLDSYNRSCRWNCLDFIMSSSFHFSCSLNSMGVQASQRGQRGFARMSPRNISSILVLTTTPMLTLYVTKIKNVLKKYVRKIPESLEKSWHVLGATCSRVDNVGYACDYLNYLRITSYLIM